MLLRRRMNANNADSTLIFYVFVPPWTFLLQNEILNNFFKFFASFLFSRVKSTFPFSCFALFLLLLFFVDLCPFIIFFSLHSLLFDLTPFSLSTLNFSSCSYINLILSFENFPIEKVKWGGLLRSNIREKFLFRPLCKVLKRK